jgi:putative transposase
MINRHHPELSISVQCQLLQLPRSSFYYQPKPESEANLSLMRRMDELHLNHPFAGSRMLTLLLNQEDFSVGRKRVRHCMRKMGIEALYRKPNTSKQGKGHQVYPYLLRDLVIDRPNQVWATDITYIPMQKGFVYLCCVMDWFSRKVLAWRLSNTLTTDFCIEAVLEAISHYGKPTIFNTDQGAQFTSDAFTGLLTAHGIQISMDGKGCWRDNVFVERLWRSIKYEEVYLKAYDPVLQAKQNLSNYLAFYNQQQPHQSLQGKTPNQFYSQNLVMLQQAA